MAEPRVAARRCGPGLTPILGRVLGLGLGPVLGLVLALGGWTASAAGDPSPIALALPLDCIPDRDCWVTNYVDLDPGPGARDYACGPRSYDGHGGTDFAIGDLVRMAEGVTVRAAAAGRVIATRGQVADRNVKDIDEANLEGRFCGNGLRIDHGGGWTTQYCHMKQNSLLAAKGETVTRGQALGQVGLSGKTEFPHLHLTVRFEGRRVDPFRGLTPGPDCGTGPQPLWQAKALAALPYQPVTLQAAGFAIETPDGRAIQAGRYRAATLPVAAPLLVFWYDAYGVQTGDEISLTLTGPEGMVASATQTMPKVQARRWGYSGRKRRGAAWPAGLYRGEALLRRNTPEGPIERRIEATVELR